MIFPDRLSIIWGSTARQEFIDADEVDFDGFVPALGLGGEQRPDRPLHGGRCDQHVHAAESDSHPIHRGRELFQVAHVGAQAQGVAAGLLDFELGEIQFRLAACQQPDTRSGLRESQGQPFSDSASGAGDQYVLTANAGQKSRFSMEPAIHSATDREPAEVTKSRL